MLICVFKSCFMYMYVCMYKIIVRCRLIKCTFTLLTYPAFTLMISLQEGFHKRSSSTVST